MVLPRRALLIGASAFVAPRGIAATLAPVRIGVLRYGSVHWELAVIARHGLDRKAGVSIAPHVFASSQATQVALQAGNVDTTVQDWLWASRQRAVGADYTFAPNSSSMGGVVVPAGSSIRSVAALRGHRLGVAGTPIDKSWLILRAYGKEKLGFDPDQACARSFGAPPLLEEELLAQRLDAALTYWPYVARAEVAGMRTLMRVDQALTALGVPTDVPITGYVMSDTFVHANSATVRGFLTAAAQARSILLNSDAEWQTIRHLTGATSDDELAKLRAAYRAGVPRAWGKPQMEAAAALYAVLSRVGGRALTGGEAGIAPGTFMKDVPV